MLLLISLSFACFFAAHFLNQRDRALFRKSIVLTLRTIGGLLLLQVCFIYWATPEIQIPKPTGVYAVGLTEVEIQTDRPEPYTPNPTDKRRLHIKIWYPANITQGQQPYAPYTSPSMAKVHANKISSIGPLGFLAPFLENQLAAAKLSAVLDATPPGSGDRFPLLLFSHGHRAHLDFFSTTLQDVASHGYIVVGINHSYEVPHSVLPSGRTLVRNNRTFDIKGQYTQNEVKAFEKELQRLEVLLKKYEGRSLSNDDMTAYTALYNHIIDHPQELSTDLPIRVQDLFSTLKYLEKLPSGEGTVSSIIDLERIGAFGMSFGGPTSAEFCRQFGRCFAAANIDGKNWGNMLRKQYSVPMLWITGDYTKLRRHDITHTLHNWAGPAFRVYIPGALHQAFTDAPLLSPLLETALLQFPYNVQPKGHAAFIHKATNNALVSFFNHFRDCNTHQIFSELKHLKGVSIEQPNTQHTCSYE